MSIDGIRQTIREKTRSEQVASKTAVVRQLLTEIEAATAAGFTYVQIAEWLKPTGLEVSGRHLAVIVSQIRKCKKTPAPTHTKQMQIFDRLKVDRQAETQKKFRHNPTATGEGLI